MIRLTRKRLIVTAVVLSLLTGIVTIAWEVYDWPPIRLIMKYGFPPAGGPTGRTRQGPIGLVFMEIRSGYAKFEPPRDRAINRTLLDILRSIVRAEPEPRLRRAVWVEVAHNYWIGTTRLPGNSLLQQLKSGGFLRAYPLDRDLYCSALVRYLSGRGAGTFSIPTIEQWRLAQAYGIIEGFQGQAEPVRIDDRDSTPITQDAWKCAKQMMHVPEWPPPVRLVWGP